MKATALPIKTGMRTDENPRHAPGLGFVPQRTAHRSTLSDADGFTLLELVVIIALIGILAIVALPRLQDVGLKQRAFHDQTLAVLRYAQKAAVAQRRTVCVTSTASSVTLTIAATAGSSTCGTNLTGPASGSPYAITAPSGVSFSSSSSFNFNAQGQASSSATFQVSGVSESITVEQETGYVH